MLRRAAWLVEGIGVSLCVCVRGSNHVMQAASRSVMLIQGGCRLRACALPPVCLPPHPVCAWAESSVDKAAIESVASDLASAACVAVLCSAPCRRVRPVTTFALLHARSSGITEVGALLVDSVRYSGTDLLSASHLASVPLVVADCVSVVSVLVAAVAKALPKQKKSKKKSKSAASPLSVIATAVKAVISAITKSLAPLGKAYTPFTSARGKVSDAQFAFDASQCASSWVGGEVRGCSSGVGVRGCHSHHHVRFWQAATSLRSKVFTRMRDSGATNAQYLAALTKDWVGFVRGIKL